MNRALYRSLVAVATVFLRIPFQIRLKIDPRLRHFQGPAMVVGNHTNYLDPVFLGLAIPRRPLTFVAGAFAFKNPKVARFFAALDVIPKEQFRADSNAVRLMIKAIGRGDMVAIFPEGQRSLDGTSWPIHGGMGRLIQKLKVPLVMVRIRGGYMNWPRWSRSGVRFGRVDVESLILMSKEEVMASTAAQIEAKLLAELVDSDDAWQERQPRPVKFSNLRRAEGAESVCHGCPRCGHELAMRSKGVHLWCEHCGYRVKLKPEGTFVQVKDQKGSASGPGLTMTDAAASLAGEQAEPPKTVAAWRRWANSFWEPTSVLEYPCKIWFSPVDGEPSERGRGYIRLSQDLGFVFDRIPHGRPYDEAAPSPEEVESEPRFFGLPDFGIPVEDGEWFELFEKATGDRWRFAPDDPRSIERFVGLSHYLKVLTQEQTGC